MNLSPRAGRHLAPWIVPLLLVVGWQWAANRGHDAASPSAVLAAGWRLTRSHELPAHLWESSKRALVGLAIGGSLGLTLGFLNGLSFWANRLFDSSIQMLRNVPHLVLIPLVILWFGVGEEAKQFLILDGGAHIVASDDLYGGTFRLFERVRRRSENLSFSFVDLTNPKNLLAALRPETKRGILLCLPSVK